MDTVSPMTNPPLSALTPPNHILGSAAAVETSLTFGPPLETMQTALTSAIFPLQLPGS